MPTVSVIIPTYNRANLVTKAIDSVLEQTFKDLEIIVIDDGSKDQTQEVLKSYQNKILYLYQENQGRASARNRGLEIAQGKYIAFLDSDDFWKPEKLHRQLHFFEQHPHYGVVATQCIVHVVDENLQTLKYVQGEEVHYELTYEKIFQRPFIKTPSVLIKRQCFEEIGNFNEYYRLLEDIDIWLRLARKYHIGFINEPLTVYTRGHEKEKRDSLEARINRLQISEKNYDPSLISKRVYKKRISSLHAHIGKHYIQRGEIQKGKESLLTALSIDRFNLRAMKQYLFALCKEKILKLLR